MITQTIAKAPSYMIIEYIQGKRTREEIDRANSVAVNAWNELYRSIENALYSYAYWDDKPVVSQSGESSFLRHLLTRSTKQDNALQLTAFQVKHGELIPLSDIQITDPAELFREVPNTAKVNIF